MHQVITRPREPLQLRISRSAQAALDRRESPLLLELELYFSCLVRKRVHVRDELDADAVVLNDKLRVRFRPVVTQQCAMRDVEPENPPVMDMPAVNPQRFFPHWLTLDFRRGHWIAEFGYATAA